MRTHFMIQKSSQRWEKSRQLWVNNSVHLRHRDTWNSNARRRSHVFLFLLLHFYHIFRSLLVSQPSHEYSTPKTSLKFQYEKAAVIFTLTSCRPFTWEADELMWEHSRIYCVYIWGQRRRIIHCLFLHGIGKCTTCHHCVGLCCFILCHHPVNSKLFWCWCHILPLEAHLFSLISSGRIYNARVMYGQANLDQVCRGEDPQRNIYSYLQVTVKINAQRVKVFTPWSGLNCLSQLHPHIQSLRL